VVWAEGILLTQQHFQSWDRYQQVLRIFEHRYLHPLDWGIIELTIDEDALENGYFTLKKCKAIFKERISIDYTQQQGVDLSVAIKSSTTESPIEIFLAIPKNHKVKGIIGYEDLESNHGFVGHYENIADEQDYHRQREILVATQRILLLQSGEPLDGFYRLKISEVHCKHENGFAMSNSYIPPLMFISANALLKEKIKRLYYKVSGALTHLNTLQGVSGRGEIISLLKGLSLAKIVYALQMMLESKTMHPQELYKALVEFIIDFKAVSGIKQCSSFNHYKHEDFFKLLSSLEEEIYYVLSLQDNTSIESIKAQRVDNDTWIMDILDGSFFNKKSSIWIGFYLEKELRENEQVVIENIKIAAPSRLQSIIDCCISGIRLSDRQKPPQSLKSMPNYYYFCLERDNEEWQYIEVEQKISLHFPGSHSDTDVSITMIPQ